MGLWDLLGCVSVFEHYAPDAGGLGSPERRPALDSSFRAPLGLWTYQTVPMCDHRSQPLWGLVGGQSLTCRSMHLRRGGMILRLHFHATDSSTYIHISIGQYRAHESLMKLTVNVLMHAQELCGRATSYARILQMEDGGATRASVRVCDRVSSVVCAVFIFLITFHQTC